jgi:hypothetical protein
MSSTIRELRALVQDETLPITARREAAEHLVRLKAKEVPSVPDDDAEVVALTKPWPVATDVQAGIASMFAAYSQGLSLLEARNEVSRRLALRVQLSAVIDVTLPHLERLETVRAILANLPDGHIFRLNGVSAERLLAVVNGPSDTRYYRTEDGGWEYRPVNVPPMQLDDVFDTRKVFGRGA